eukprot:9498081-Pyramimonas_sp.AAC.1
MDEFPTLAAAAFPSPRLDSLPHVRGCSIFLATAGFPTAPSPRLDSLPRPRHGWIPFHALATAGFPTTPSPRLDSLPRPRYGWIP